VLPGRNLTSFQADSKQKIIKKDSRCIQVWSYLTIVSATLALVKVISHIFRIQEYSKFSWFDKEGTLRTYQFDTLVITFYFLVTIGYNVISLMQSKLSLEVVESVLKEYKMAARNTQGITMTRRSKQTESLISYIKKLAVAGMVARILFMMTVSSLTTTLVNDVIV
jgi:hypothetical protein